MDPVIEITVPVHVAVSGLKQTVANSNVTDVPSRYRKRYIGTVDTCTLSSFLISSIVIAFAYCFLFCGLH